MIFYGFYINFYTTRISKVNLPSRKCIYIYKKTGASLAITNPKAADRWFHTYTNLGGKKHILKNSTAPVIIIGDSVVAGLRRYVEYFFATQNIVCDYML